MDPEIAIPAIIVAALVAGALGFLLGRRAVQAADRTRVEELEGELEAARSRAEERERELEGELGAARAGVDQHFEASAELLGQLARDYRALFEHWADGATRLGGSATRAEAIIEQARERLLIGEPEGDGPDAAADAPADEADEEKQVSAAAEASTEVAAPDARIRAAGSGPAEASGTEEDSAASSGDARPAADAPATADAEPLGDEVGAEKGLEDDDGVHPHRQATRPRDGSV